MTTIFPACEILDRMERAILKVRERLLRATMALDKANIPYAVICGNAVGTWVAKGAHDMVCSWRGQAGRLSGEFRSMDSPQVLMGARDGETQTEPA